MRILVVNAGSSSLKLSLLDHDDTVLAKPDYLSELHDLPTPGATTVGRGTKVGTVYQLPDGRLVYVTDGSTAAPTGQPTGLPTGQPTSPPAGQPTGLPTGSTSAPTP